MPVEDYTPPAKRFAHNKRTSREFHENDTYSDSASPPSSPTIPEESTRTKAPNEKQLYLETKAKSVKMPTPEEAQLVPKYLYDDPIFIIHMCNACRAINRNLPTFNVDSEYQRIEMNLCRICRSAFNSQRRMKFFKFDLLCAKRNRENRKTELK